MEPREPEHHGREIYAPTQSFTANVDGQAVTFMRGVTLVREGHPILRLHPELFEPVRVEYDVEDATMVPGQRRQR